MTNKTRKMTQEEMRWRAEDDARIMAQYQEIMNDKSRLARATKEATRQAQELQKRANMMKNVGRRKNTNGKKGN